MIKLCPLCNTVQGFYKKPVMKICKKCHSKRMSARIANNKIKNSKVLSTFKGTGCQICKNIFPEICLDFDRLSNKRWNIGHMYRFISEKTLLAEISKCQIICSNCHRTKTYNEKYANKEATTNIEQRKWLKEHKSTKPCKDCNGLFHFAAMDFDHQRDKFSEIGKMMSYTIERIKEEIAKCDLICSNCHRIRHSSGLKSKISVSSVINLR